MTPSIVLRSGNGRWLAAMLGACVAALFAPQLAAAADMPAGIVDPDQAIANPLYSDPVFWWRMSSIPKDYYEPDAYFYWPAAVVHGRPGAALPLARSGKTSVPTKALDAAQAWAGARKTNALIVIHKGVVQLEHYWNGMKPDELANGRAITRSVTPMLLGFAVADGRLSLDDPIGRFITEWQSDPRGRITVRQLAQYVSGLEVQAAHPVDIRTVASNKDLCLAYCGDVVRAALSYGLSRPPGTWFEDAQENTQLLALVIERAMGMPIQVLLSERVWQQIGASDAAYQFDRPGGTARVMCCMRARPMDWARLGLLLAQGGLWDKRQVLPAGWVRTMATPSPRNPNFGLGLWLGSPYVAMRGHFEGQPGVIPQSEPFLADDVLILEGGGFRTMFVVPSRALVILRHGQQVSDWDNAYLVNTVLRGLNGH